MSSKIHATSHVHIYPSKPAIGLAAAQHVADISAAAIQARGRVLVAISGGSLPKILTSGMLDGNVAQTIDFDKWHVFFADERIVPLDHDDSNFKACNDVMFSQVSASETFVQQIYSIGNGNEGKDPAQVAADYQVKVQEQLKLSNGAFDLVLLGKNKKKKKQTGRMCRHWLLAFFFFSSLSLSLSLSLVFSVCGLSNLILSLLILSLLILSLLIFSHLLTCSLAHLLSCSLAHLLTCSLAHLLSARDGARRAHGIFVSQP